MLGLPSPGQVTSFIGQGMQAAENFVSGAVNGAVDAVQSFASEPASNTTTLYSPTGTAAPVVVSGTVSADDFQAFQNLVANAFDAVRSDIAAIRANGPANDGVGGMLEGNGGGGGMNNNLLLVLALSGGLGGTTTSLTSNPLLLILLLGNGGLGSNGGMGLAEMMALGVI